MWEVIDQLLTRVTCHLSVFWITQGRPRICCGEKHRTKTLILKETKFPLNRFFQISSSRSEFKLAEGSEKRIILSKRTKVANICAGLKCQEDFHDPLHQRLHLSVHAAGLEKCENIQDIVFRPMAF